MTKQFKDAAAFRASLEQRLKTTAETRGVNLNYLRLKLVIERLLARLFSSPTAPWLLKGGYAMELRYRPRARTTRDIDLSVPAPATASSIAARLIATQDELQEAAELDLGDFLQFRIGAPQTELQGAPLGGGRFPCEALLAGRTYTRFHIDLGFGDPALGTPEALIGEDFLDFAGITPPSILAIPRVQQFAEKVHAYTFRWADRENTRTRDLVDLLLLIDGGLTATAELGEALRATFDARKTHPVPSTLPEPPESWREEFAATAGEIALSTADLGEAFTRLAAFWGGVR